MPLLINLRHLERDDLSLEGELPVGDLELADLDAQIHVSGPLYYDLTAQKLGHDILVRGRLQLTLDCECVRCLKPFQFEIDLPDWATDLPLEGEEKVAVKNDFVDLTPHIRDDIVLAFPQYPLCESNCAGLPKRKVQKAKKPKSAKQTEDSSAWSVLNKLKF